MIRIYDERTRESRTLDPQMEHDLIAAFLAGTNGSATPDYPVVELVIHAVKQYIGSVHQRRQSTHE